MSQLLRSIDGFWFVLCVALSAMFCQYVLTRRGLVPTNAYSAALGLGLYFVGETIIKAVRVVAHQTNHTQIIGFVVLVGFIVSVIGVSMIVRVFSAAYWSRWAWMVIGLIAIVAALAVTAI